MKLASILRVEDCDADAAFFRDFFERRRICNQVTRMGRVPGRCGSLLSMAHFGNLKST
jgi:hypothetical protein